MPHTGHHHIKFVNDYLDVSTRLDNFEKSVAYILHGPKKITIENFKKYQNQIANFHEMGLLKVNDYGDAVDVLVLGKGELFKFVHDEMTKALKEPSQQTLFDINDFKIETTALPLKMSGTTPVSSTSRGLTSAAFDRPKDSPKTPPGKQRLLNREIIQKPRRPT